MTMFPDFENITETEPETCLGLSAADDHSHSDWLTATDPTRSIGTLLFSYRCLLSQSE
jgi:hypothetical protein